MDLVRRSVMISREQDEFLKSLRRQRVSGSVVVRLALDDLMRQPHIVVPSDTTQSAKVITVRVQEVAR